MMNRKRIHSMLLFDSLLTALLLLMTSCAPEEGNKPDEGPSPAGTVEEYLPLLADTAYLYEMKEGTRTIFTDYLVEGQAQQRVNSGAEEYSQILSVLDGKATISILSPGGLFRQNYLTDPKSETQPQTISQTGIQSSAEILLMEPLLPGTRWILSDGSARVISDTALRLDTPLGPKDAVSVVTESRSGQKTIDYYAKGIGLIRQDGPEGTLLLAKVDEDTSSRYHIRFFYPDFSEHEILSLTYTIGFQTNDRTEDILLSAYRNLTKAQGIPVLSERAVIHGITRTGDTLTVDWNSGFLELESRTSVEEGMLLQCAANTLGNLYQSQQVQLTIDGTLYLSRHISLEDLPLTVSEEEYPLFYDLVVYGGTASGVVGAVSAAREGAQVALLEPGRHLGGMLSGGLGYTDRGDASKIGGLAREVFQRIGSKYGREI